VTKLHGVIAPVCTPFDENGEVDHEALQQNISKYNDAGLAGFVICGSTGEAPLLNREEKLKLFETARDAADGRVLIAGAGVESVRETLSLIRDAAKLGFDATLVLTPHYFRAQMLRPETQLTFFRAVADESPLPVLVYNFPQMTGIDLAVDVFAQLSEHPNIIGLKESSADLAKIAALTSTLPAGFDIFVGASPKFHDCLSLGARGGILAGANVLPHSMQRVYDLFQAGEVPASRVLQQTIAPCTGVAAQYGIQGLKYAMDLKGLFGGLPRPPLLPLDVRQKMEIEALFQGVE